MNYIFRTCFNRPEMLYLSLKYEQEARNLAKDFYITTFFLIDGGAAVETYHLAEEFPFPKKIIKRPSNYGITRNTMEGIKTILEDMDTFFLPVEEDILLHKNFLQFIKKNISVISLPDTACFLTGETYRKEEVNNLGFFENPIPWYCPWGTVITKNFIKQFLAENFIITRNGWHIQLPDGRPTGLDEIMILALKKGNWKTYQTHINRFLNIGVYGFDFRADEKIFPIGYQERIKWFEEHLLLGDWWQYSKTMKEIVSNVLPETICKFNPLLDTEVF